MSMASVQFSSQMHPRGRLPPGRMPCTDPPTWTPLPRQCRPGAGSRQSPCSPIADGKSTRTLTWAVVRRRPLRSRNTVRKRKAVRRRWGAMTGGKVSQGGVRKGIEAEMLMAGAGGAPRCPRWQRATAAALNKESERAAQAGRRFARRTGISRPHGC